MKKLISCEFNMDTVCVELKYSDGSMIAIDTTAGTDVSPTWTVAADGAIYELFVMDEVLFWRTQGEDTLTRSELDAQSFADLFG